MGSLTSKIERSMDKRGVRVGRKERLRPSSHQFPAHIQDLLDQGYDVEYLGRIYPTTCDPEENRYRMKIVLPKKYTKPGRRHSDSYSDSDAYYFFEEVPRHNAFSHTGPRPSARDYYCYYYDVPHEEAYEYRRTQTSHGLEHRTFHSYWEHEEEEEEELDDATYVNRTPGRPRNSSYTESKEERGDGTYVTRMPRVDGRR
jgi:hypothetical protein